METSVFRPMLSATVKDLHYDVIYPVLASPKLDGIRAIIREGKLYSRRMKLIPNIELVARYNGFENYEGYDGELILGDPKAKDCFTKTTSAVMSRFTKVHDVYFYVFDRVTPRPLTFQDRLDLVKTNRNKNIWKVSHKLLNSVEEAVAYEEECIYEGYEGIILRAPWQVYKQGRSTLGEQGMMKVKRFYDSEALVVGLEEKMHNANEATKDERGYTKRTSHRANQIPAGTLGAIVVEWRGMRFNIGTGFDDAARQAIWKAPRLYIGKIAKFKYLPTVKDAPRHPVFLGWRED